MCSPSRRLLALSFSAILTTSSAHATCPPEEIPIPFVWHDEGWPADENHRCPDEGGGSNVLPIAQLWPEPARIRGHVVFRDWRYQARAFADRRGSVYGNAPLYRGVSSSKYLAPLRHARVELWDRNDLVADELVGKAVTSARGSFTFDLAGWQDADDGGDPDLYVKVFLEGVLPFDGPKNWANLGAIYQLGATPEVLWTVKLPNLNEDQSMPCDSPLPAVISTRDKPGGLLEDVGSGDDVVFPESFVFGSDVVVDIFEPNGGTENPDLETTAANLFAITDLFMHRMAAPDRGRSLLTCDRLLGPLAGRCLQRPAPLEIRLCPDLPTHGLTESQHLIKIGYDHLTLASVLPHELGHWFHLVATDEWIDDDGTNGVQLPCIPGIPVGAVPDWQALTEGFAEFIKVVTSWHHDAPEPMTWDLVNDIQDGSWETSRLPPGGRRVSTCVNAWCAVRSHGKAFFDLWDAGRDHNIPYFPDPHCSAASEAVAKVHDDASRPLEDFYEAWVAMANEPFPAEWRSSLWTWWIGLSVHAASGDTPVTAEDQAVLFPMHLTHCQLRPVAVRDDLGTCDW